MYRSLIPWFLCGRRSGSKLSLHRSLLCFLPKLCFFFLPLVDPAPTDKHIFDKKKCRTAGVCDRFKALKFDFVMPTSSLSQNKGAGKTGYIRVHRKARGLTVRREPIKSWPYRCTVTRGEGLTHGFKNLVRIAKLSCFSPAKHLTVPF